MATATPEKLTLSKALALLKPVIAKDDELSKRIQHYSAVLQPFNNQHERRPPSADDLLEAEGFLPETRIEGAKVKLERRKLEAEVERMQKEEREQLRARFIAEERKLVAQLEDALRAAIVINEKLRQAQQTRHEQ